MNKALARIALILVLIGTSYVGFEAKACTCGAHTTPYREYQEARAVFIGKVVSSRDIALTENWGEKTFTAYERVFQFSVIESLKGPKTAKVEINLGRIDSSCYQGFGVGVSYLVYAFGSSDSNLSTGVCTRTNNLAYAADDIHYLRDLIKAVPEPRVYGSVTRVDADVSGSAIQSRVTPMSGIKILIEGNRRRFETVTDNEGLYSFARIPDGQYKVHPVLPKNYMTYFPTEEEFVLGAQEPQGFNAFRMQQGSAAFASFQIGWSNRLSGRIVDSEGNAVTRANVAVVLARNPSPLVVAREHFDYRPKGKFEFYGLTPGKYLLSVDIRAPFIDKNRATRFYYPNADTVSLAEEIALSATDTFENRDITLPPEYVVRQIEGVLVWPNGVPVSGGWVFLAASKDSADDDKKFDSDSTDAIGRFSIQAFVGAEYWVHGSSNSSGKGEPIKVTVEKINEPVKVVIPFPKRIEP